MAAGVVVFSLSLLLSGLTNSYWQLVILRMGIAAGKACLHYSLPELLTQLDCRQMSRTDHFCFVISCQF